jgi:hypothetical protein
MERFIIAVIVNKGLIWAKKSTIAIREQLDGAEK